MLKMPTNPGPPWGNLSLVDIMLPAICNLPFSGMHTSCVGHSPSITGDLLRRRDKGEKIELVMWHICSRSFIFFSLQPVRLN